MRYEDVAKRVRSAAGDETVLQFTNETLMDWMNDAVIQCAVDNNLLQKTATSSLVPGQNEYSLPTDILKLHSVKVDGEKLSVKSLEEFDKLIGKTLGEDGMPLYAYVWATKLTLHPTPQNAVPLRIDYTYHPPAITEASLSSEIPLPVGYHRRIVDYCLAQVAEQDDDMNRYQLKMQEFSTGVSKLIDQDQSEQDLYPSISVSPEDYGWN